MVTMVNTIKTRHTSNLFQGNVINHNMILKMLRNVGKPLFWFMFSIYLRMKWKQGSKMHNSSISLVTMSFRSCDLVIAELKFSECIFSPILFLFSTQRQWISPLTPSLTHGFSFMITLWWKLSSWGTLRSTPFSDCSPSVTQSWQRKKQKVGRTFV